METASGDQSVLFASLSPNRGEKTLPADTLLPMVTIRDGHAFMVQKDVPPLHPDVAVHSHQVTFATVVF
jgi:hypothetical protein